MRFTTHPSRWTRLMLELMGVLAFVTTLSVSAVAVAQTETETAAETVAETVAEAVAEAVAEPLAEEVIEPTLHATFLGDEYVEATEPASDVFLFGKQAVISTEVQDNALLVAQVAEVRDGFVDGDLLAVGEVITIDAPVAGDVYAFGGTLQIKDEGVVGGDIYIGAGKLVVEGKVGGQIQGGVGAAFIDGPVGEICELEVGELRLGENAHIAGDLVYSAPEQAIIEGGAVIAGVTQFTEVVSEECEGCDDDDDGSILGWLFMHIWLFLAALLTGSVLIRITGPAASRTSAALLGQPGRSLGLGFVAMIVIPVASLMAIALVIPMPLGFIGLALYGIAFYVTGLIAAHAVGRALMRRFTGRDEVSPYASLAVGLLVVQFFLAIPFVGFLARMAILSAGLGALWVASRDSAPLTPDAA